MINALIEKVDKINFIIDCIDDRNYDSAKDGAVTLRDEIQEEIDKIDSDVDVQLQLDMERKWGK